MDSEFVMTDSPKEISCPCTHFGFFRFYLQFIKNTTLNTELQLMQLLSFLIP